MFRLLQSHQRLPFLLHLASNLSLKQEDTYLEDCVDLVKALQSLMR